VKGKAFDLVRCRVRVWGGIALFCGGVFWLLGGFGVVFYFFYDGVGHLGCSYGCGVVAVWFHVVGYVFSLCDNGGDGVFEVLCFRYFAEVAKHQDGA